ncbi:hypothetical protein TUZN_0917 [Thermoproteus uzoniensis 768-20]|uniref:Uncharacterized protein n=1 Tax=Thermoproteus uzoniensis (strain 768-20) TaxID=999630 RepID=F2L5V6_THEU7|nr:hypothetical protein [Thermoproteus uzoniensis]AEA12401.1 hypothetical protein TUZN_0917 [Thermoproteus uzoniensis 768-20]
MSFQERVRKEAATAQPVANCEVNDFDAFSSLVPPALQNAVLDALRAGSIPPELQPLLRRLREAGILVCT